MRKTTRGYDFANVWLNFLKILIGLLVVYRYALTDQLKIDIFQTYHIVDSTLSRQVADSDNPEVQFRFIPVVVRGRIEELALTLQVDPPAPGSEVKPEDPAWVVKWPKPGDIQQVSLNLANILGLREGQFLPSGIFQVKYKIHFRESGKEMFTWPDPDSEQRSVAVTYSAESVPLGTLLIARGQAANYPEALRQRPHLFSKGLSSGAIRADESNGAGRFVARADAPLGSLKLAGNFTDGKHEQFSLEMYVLPNEPPMSICGSSGSRVNLYYEDREYLDNYQLYGMDLSMCIIDPDGKRYRPLAAEPGFLLGRCAVEPNVAVGNISILRSPAGYRIGQRRGKFYLLIGGKGPVPGATGDEVTFVADGHPIQATVQRIQ